MKKKAVVAVSPIQATTPNKPSKPTPTKQPAEGLTQTLQVETRVTQEDNPTDDKADKQEEDEDDKEDDETNEEKNEADDNEDDQEEEGDQDEEEAEDGKKDGPWSPDNEEVDHDRFAEMQMTFEQRVNMMWDEIKIMKEEMIAINKRLGNDNNRVANARAKTSRAWTDNEKIRLLPTVSTAPILVLNGPKDKDVLDWIAKRDNLLKRWIEIGVYDPDQTWGKSANALQKIQMVCLFFCLVLLLHVRSRMCVCVCLCSQCCDANEILGWTAAEFDSRMEYLNTNKRKRGRDGGYSVGRAHVATCAHIHLYDAITLKYVVRCHIMPSFLPSCRQFSISAVLCHVSAALHICLVLPQVVASTLQLPTSKDNADARTPRKADQGQREDDTVTFWKRGQLVSLQDKDGDAFAHAVVIDGEPCATIFDNNELVSSEHIEPGWWVHLKITSVNDQRILLPNDSCFSHEGGTLAKNELKPKALMEFKEGIVIWHEYVVARMLAKKQPKRTSTPMGNKNQIGHLLPAKSGRGRGR